MRMLMDNLAPTLIDISPTAWRFAVGIFVHGPFFEIEGGTSVFRLVPEPPAYALLPAIALGIAVLGCATLQHGQCEPGSEPETRQTKSRP